MDFEKVLELFRALNEQNVQYVVFGGVALGAHGIPRATVYEMKRDTVRPKDRSDADALRARFGFED